MAGVPPNSMRKDEQNEQPLTGPFGGVQSEAPLSRIEDIGFADAGNIWFRKGAAQVRSLLKDTPALPDPVMGIADFFDVKGIRHQVVMTTTSLYEWNPGTQAWTQITGTLTGNNEQLFTWTVVDNQLCFCQGQDLVQSWDGIATSFGPVGTASVGGGGGVVPAKYLFELDTHLLAMNTTETGTGGVTQAATQRVHWSAAGDPADWTSFDAGEVDLLNDLGPITGGVKLFQSGFVMQYWGITQAIPTGQAIAPFEFIPLSSRAKGSVIPHSLSNFGEDIACYVGKDNVYQFDGNLSVPIGDSRIDGTKYRSGARKRILADLQYALFDTVFGFITTSINGADYFAYWLFLPLQKMAWVYHFDENSWTRETFAQTPTYAGNFFNQSIPQIRNLVGTIAQQVWSPATMTGGTPFDGLLIGFDDSTQTAAPRIMDLVGTIASQGWTLGGGPTGPTPRYIDFTGLTEQPWFIQSGNMHFRDFKHKKTITAVRLVVDDIYKNFTADLTLTTNKGYVQTQHIGPVGTASGDSLTIVVPFQPAVTGTWIKWKLNGAANTPLNLTEITPVYDVGGTVRAGGVD